ncbi:MAG: aldo/keto reductase [Bacteroidetes bacterium]|jgi:aryl-alcohol dehydrogenase-like predicted oxidoreductase|nr:aldo/keto reductase [Bacteroidota bacterium]
MEQRAFGTTGLTVPILGLGTGRLGRLEVSEREAERLLHGAVDMGVALIDTARSYGLAEERIGRHLSGRRSRVILSTKVGYGIPGIPDLTYDAVVAGVKEALTTMRTDHIDIVHLHSFPAEIVRSHGLLDALHATVNMGLVRVAAYSGDNQDLDWIVSEGRVGSVQCSFNICDQHLLHGALGHAKHLGLGVIAKRPLANAPWTHTTRPNGDDAATYWERWNKMALRFDAAPEELFLRFAAFTWGVDAVITGVSGLDHLRANAVALAKGPLPADLYEAVRNAFEHHGAGWPSVT